MRFVDEFRDAELGRAVAGQILSLVEPGRHYKLMEVCGGHTHSIYKYGIDDLLPANVELVHGPGCPVCVIPMGRVDDGIAVAHEDGVIFTCFGDMMRVPGSDGSLLDAKAAGADIRMVYSPLDALRIAKQNPDREVVFFAIGFETTAPSTALTLRRARAEGVPNFSVMCSHVTIVPPLRALLESPDLRLDGFIGPGHVSTVVGARPFEFIPIDYGRPVVISGFEPLDILQGIEMILRQLAAGRCEVENQYKRVVPYEGNLRALEVMAEVFELRPHFEWRGLGFISHSGLKLTEAYAELDAEVRFSVPGVRVADPKACQCGEVLKGVIKPWECKVFGTACTPGAADRHLHGVLRGRLCRLLQLRPIRAGTRGGVMPEPRGCLRARADGPPDHRDRPRQAGQVPRRAHHHGPRSGRQGHAEADRGSAGAGLSLRHARRAGRRRDRPRRRRALALTTDSYVVKPLRFPGGSIGELAVNGTVNDLAVSGARPLALSLSLILEEGLAADELRAEVEAIARAADAAGVGIITGDTKVVERGHADGMYICTSGVGSHDPRAHLSPAALRPGDRILLSGSIGEHGTAIMLARNEFELDAEIESDTRSLWPVVDALLETAGPGAALPARRHARRRGLGAQRTGARVVGGDDRARGRGAGAARGGRRGRDPGHRPHVRRQRGQARGVRGTRAGRRGAGGDARGARVRVGGGDRRGAHRAARDGAGGDELWRSAGDGSAGRRPAAADLLSERRVRWRHRRARMRSRRRRRRSPHTCCG